MFINEATQQFIRQHRDDDVRQLALRGTKDADVDLTLALQQIAGRQTARRKLPSWAAVEGIAYPPHLNMEQCSSEQTARYKAKIVNDQSVNGQFVDLTGGLGVDFWAISSGFRHATYVEQSADLCALAAHNLPLLGVECSVVCGTAADYLATMEPADLIFLDPARRDAHGGRTYSIEDCTPNVVELLPLLMQKARRVLLKLSPMLDWHQAVETLQHVTEVHIVSVANECKELLLVMEQKQTMGLRLCCVNDGSSFEIVYSGQTPTYPAAFSELPGRKLLESCRVMQSDVYLYEPNASIMKAGCFAEVEQRFGVRQVAYNSHLFLTPDEIADFPGRGFQILAISSMNKKEWKEKVNQRLTSLESANIAVRNFPLSADQLRKKLKLRDGGSVFIFATTVQNGQHRLFICRKIS